MHEMLKNYNNCGGDHASKNDDTPMCERHEANYIRSEGCENQNSYDSFSHQSLHDPTDKATYQNLKGLVTVGQMLIEKPVSRVNFDTGVFEALPDGGTNCEALKKFAKELLDEQKQWECLI
ncbi:hypothetical protein Tco_1044825 [Tanacetum coccineum]|uniref:Uncharacterized protein n=1 Tax=Tanacetum coccineum TaxID=301880 RepID=A0ABQ5GRS1_9ASTR